MQPLHIVKKIKKKGEDLFATDPFENNRNHKPIRNRLRKLNYDSVVILLLKVLKKQDSNRVQPQAFWHPLLLLKWAMEFCGTGTDMRTADESDIAELLTMLSELENFHDTFDLKTNGRISKTFTILSVQQFSYQEVSWWDTLARQQILFNQLVHKYDISASFEKRTGIPVVHFLKIMYIFHVILFQEEATGRKYDSQRLEEGLEIIKEVYGETLTLNLVNMLAVSRDTISGILETDPRNIKNYDLQVFETSFFTRRPLLNFRGTMRIPHREVFNHTINYFIYDYMKSTDEQFSTELGIRMEKYINMGLSAAGLKFQTENELKKNLGINEKVVDFLVDECVIIEAKAIELKPYAGINPTDSILGNEMRKSIVKAYAQQMISVANRIPEATECFGIIVTYKKLHLGTSKDVWEQFLMEETLKQGIDQELLARLPFKNLFFLDLRSWDALMQVIKERTVSLTSLLMEIREADQTPAMVKFTFDMHLDKYKSDILDLPYLVAAKAIIQNCVEL